MDRLTLLSSSCLYNREPGKSLFNHPDFKFLCGIIQEIQMNTGPKGNDPMYNPMEYNLRSMKNVFRRMFGVNFEITIIDNCGYSDFFGCYVFPDYDSLVNISDKILENKTTDFKNIWINITNWQLDLDSRLFFDTSIGFNSGEIAALIIYNIERIVFSTRIPEYVRYLIIKTLTNQSLLVTKLSKTSVCKRFFLIPLILACKFHNYTHKFITGSCLNRELGKVYNTMLVKMVSSIGNKDIDLPGERFAEDITNSLNWFFACVDDMRFSTKMLSDAIEKLMLIEISIYVKNILGGIRMDIGDYNREQTIAKESMVPRERELFRKKEKAVYFRMEQYYKAAIKKIEKEFAAVYENYFIDVLDNIGSVKKVSQREIDMIRIQAQKIQNADDKLYVMDNLHNKLEIVNASLALLESKDSNKIRKVKVPKATLLDQKKQLEDIRDTIIKQRVDEPGNSLLVIYPDGYAG